MHSSLVGFETRLQSVLIVDDALPLVAHFIGKTGNKRSMNLVDISNFVRQSPGLDRNIAH